MAHLSTTILRALLAVCAFASSVRAQVPRQDAASARASAREEKSASPKDSGKDIDGYECVISGGSVNWGSRAMRPKGDTFIIKANGPAKEMAFAEWVGNVEFLTDPRAAETMLSIPTDFPFRHIHVGAS